MKFFLLGVVGAIIGASALIWTGYALQEPPKVEVKPAQAPQVKLELEQVAPLIEVIRRSQSQLEGFDRAQAITKSILEQYDRLLAGIDVHEKMTGATSDKDRLAAAEHMLTELKVAVNGVKSYSTPQGRGLMIKTADNTFRVTFPVVMRRVPDIVIPNLPVGSTANIIEKSTVGFTVVFTPPTIPIEKFGVMASAEL